MSVVVAKALWGVGWFAAEIAIPIAVGVGLALTIRVLAAQGWVQSWTR